MTELETTLLHAFQLAENSRKAAGFAPRKARDMVKTRRDGTKTFAGPSAYKLTLWLRPWMYADAMMAKSVSTRPAQSLNRFLTEKLEELIPKVAARPEPKATPAEVVPLRKKTKSIDFTAAVRNPYPERIRAAQR